MTVGQGVLRSMTVPRHLKRARGTRGSEKVVGSLGPDLQDPVTPRAREFGLVPKP